MNTYYVSNALPLYAKCYQDDDRTPHRVYDYLKVFLIFKKNILQREGVLNFTKGIPTSLALASIQQWDKENAWPPMQWMVFNIYELKKINLGNRSVSNKWRHKINESKF